MEFERYSATLRLRGRRFPPHFLAGGSAAKMHGPEFVPFVLLAERNVLWGWAGWATKKNKRTTLSTSFSAISCLVHIAQRSSCQVLYLGKYRASHKLQYTPTDVGLLIA
jgi:hypothetical protein